MNLKKIISLLASSLLSWGVASAFESDSLTVAEDTMVRDTVKIDKGFDAGRYVNAKRWRVPAHTEFKKGTLKNISFGLHTDIIKMSGSEYSCGQSLGFDVTKWVLPSFGVRLSAGYGGWVDNLDAKRIQLVDVSASALFNLMSYVGGYDTSRFCELSLVGGVAYSRLWKKSYKADNVFSTLFGLNVEMRIYDRLHLVLEPQMNVYYNSKLHIDTWRSYMTGFVGSIGLNYNFSQVRPPQPRKTKYFISLWGGTQLQNSGKVWDSVMNGDAKDMFGVQYGLGYGRWFKDWFATRLSATYSKNAWIKTPDYSKHTQYMNLRLEVMFNLFGMWDNKVADHFALSAVLGPEIGRMIKEDKTKPLSVHYIGLSGGLNASVKVFKFLSVFVEPRFSIVPYSAASADVTSTSENRNYYDALLGANLGVNILIP